MLPRTLPHKEYEGATLEQRAAMMLRVADSEPGLSAAISERGLFIDIAQEAREHYPAAALYFLCGRDAAERIVGWDYGDPRAIHRMLEVFHLLVAPRQGAYRPPPELAHAIHGLRLADYDECSATRVREAVRQGREWKSLVPEIIHDLVEQIYR